MRVIENYLKYSKLNLASSPHKPKNNLVLKRTNTLVEENPVANWFHNVFMKTMDKYAFARAITIFCFCGFFLGNNLQIFLWLFIISTIYLLAYRLIRFWTKRYLLYLMEFCYFGSCILLAHLLFCENRIDIFSITFICNTGIMTTAVIVFNNQTPFNSTDHLTSSWIHTLPLITNWAIRWRHIIYGKETLEKLKFNLVTIGDIKFEYNDLFYGLIYYPIIFWCLWALIYTICMGCLFKNYVDDNRYFSGLVDFKSFPINKKIFGDTNSFPISKYLFQHFFLMVLMFPLTIWCFYNYYVNTLYLVFIILFLGWNTARNNILHTEKQKKKGNLVEEEF